MLVFPDHIPRWCSGFLLMVGLIQPAMAKTDSPFPETTARLSVLLQDDSSALAKGLHHEKMGQLNLASGHIMALDPLVMLDGLSAFKQTVPPGKYDVSVYWVEDKTWGKRNAFATLKFSDDRVASWHMAILDGQDTDKLKPHEFFGYDVDAGMGAFNDQ